MPNPDIFGPATLAVTQGVSSFNTFLPKLSEVRRASKEQNTDIVGDVRMGEIAAVTLSLGIGAVASSLTGSPVPVYTAAITCIVLVLLYEYALNNDRPFEPKVATNE